MEATQLTSSAMESARLTPRRARRRDSLIASAIDVINRDGVGNLDFPALMKAAGCGRAILYHYFANRSDLIYQCYRLSCLRAEELLETAATKGTGLQCLSYYIETSIASPPLPTAVVSETSMLSPEQRSEIEGRIYALYGQIERLLELGNRDGSLRRCDTPVVARVIHSMIAFSLVSRRWMIPAQWVTAAGLIEMLSHGAAGRRDFTFEYRDSADAFSRVSLANFDKQDLSELRIEQILMVASRMFNRQGIENVSLEALASELGVSRGAIYHYFDDRQDLLLRCLERGVALYHAFIDHAEQHGRCGLEKSLIIGHLNVQAQAGSLQPIMPWLGLESLPATLQPAYFEEMQRILDRTSTIREEGIEDGSRRSGRSSTDVARAGAFNWIPRWIEQLDNRSPTAIADEIVDLFSWGIGRSN